MLSLLAAATFVSLGHSAQLDASLAGVPPLTYRLGTADISPPEPLPLGGYTARRGKLCELPGDKLEARALLLEKGGLAIAIVSVDLLTVPESLYEQVSKGIGTSTKLMLVATHTHCAPDSQMLNARMNFSIPGIAKFNRKWLDWYSTRIVAAVRAAKRSRVQELSRLLVAFARIPLNRARRNFAQPDQLAFRISDGAGRLLLTSFSAHAVLYGSPENHPRTDFPGFIRGSAGLFLPGAIGDMSPESSGDSSKNQIENFAERFEAGPWKEEQWTAAPLSFCTVKISPSKVVANPEFARLNGIPSALAQSIVENFAPKDGEIMALRIGKLAVVGVPGEPTAELGRKIRSIGLGLGYRAVMVVSHCNGWMGYVLSPEDYGRGGYEASLAFHGGEFGNLLIERAETALRTLCRGI